MTARRGRLPAPASLLAWLEKDAEKTTSATSGPTCSASSETPSPAGSDLAQFLENRLRQRMGAFGSPEYELTWKRWPMTFGQPISALRASARRTSDKGYGGWPTPIMNDATGSTHAYGGKKPGGARAIYLKLPGAARLAGWRSPDANQRGGDYADPAKVLARQEAGHQTNLADQAVLAGWNTPRATDGSNGGPSQSGGALSADAALAGWPTPKRQNANASGPSRVGCRTDLQTAALGAISISSPASTEKRGVLSPDHSRWLMGYPTAWASCAPTVTRSSPRSRRK